MIVNRSQFLDAICSDPRSESPLFVYLSSDGSCHVSLMSYGISTITITLGTSRGDLHYFKSLKSLHKFFSWLNSVEGLDYSVTLSISNC